MAVGSVSFLSTVDVALVYALFLVSNGCHRPRHPNQTCANQRIVQAIETSSSVLRTLRKAGPVPNHCRKSHGELGVLAYTYPSTVEGVPGES